MAFSMVPPLPFPLVLVSVDVLLLLLRAGDATPGLLVFWLSVLRMISVTDVA